MIFLAPIPSQISSNTYSDGGRWLEKDASNFCSWLDDIVHTEPSFYMDLVGVIKKIFPDFNKIKFDDYGNFRKIKVSFVDKDSLELDFERLSDGEKLLFIFSTIVTLFGYDNKIAFVLSVMAALISAAWILKPFSTLAFTYFIFAPAKVAVG